jgi:hypothetical protein
MYKLDTLLLKQKRFPVLDKTGFIFRIRTRVFISKTIQLYIYIYIYIYNGGQNVFSCQTLFYA